MIQLVVQTQPHCAKFTLLVEKCGADNVSGRNRISIRPKNKDRFRFRGLTSLMLSLIGFRLNVSEDALTMELLLRT